MAIEVKIPQLPESVADAVIVTWHKQPGEHVAQDENLVDIETDKVVLEVPAPENGVLEKIIEEEGATVTAGQTIGILNAAAELAPSQPAAAETTTAPSQQAAQSAQARDITLTPAVRRLVSEHNIDPHEIEGTGRGGRILKEDILRFLGRSEPTPAEPSQTQPVEAEVAREEPVPMPKPSEVDAEDRAEKRVPMTRLRARIAERLVEAQHTAAILTTFNEINMKPIFELRRKYRDRFEKQHDVRLGFMSFFVKASVEALKRFPAVNASIDGNEIVYHGYFDVGVAVSSPRGLVVPILRNADRMSMGTIEKRIAELGLEAQQGSLSMEALTGGTFTISNGGIFGSLLSTPILNPPQSAILGMHKIEDRPVVENGEVVVRPMMYVALSYDHRIIDGREAVLFLVTVKEMIEDPARMLLEV